MWFVSSSAIGIIEKAVWAEGSAVVIVIFGRGYRLVSVHSSSHVFDSRIGIIISAISIRWSSCSSLWC